MWFKLVTGLAISVLLTSLRSVDIVSLAVEQNSLTGCSVSTPEKFSNGNSDSGVDPNSLFGAAHCFPHRPLCPLHS